MKGITTCLWFDNQAEEAATRKYEGAAGLLLLWSAPLPPRRGVSVFYILSAGIRHPAPLL